MHDIPDILNVALAHHQAGRLADAQALYDAILQSDPGQSDALHFSGLLACQTNRGEAGLALMRASIAANPNAVYYNNLGNALLQRRQIAEAIDGYRHAVALRPDYAEAHNNLGNALREAGDANASMLSCAKAIELRPGYPEAYNNLGNALKALGDRDSAALAYQKAVSFRPDYAEAFSNLARAQAGRGHGDESIAAFRQAIAIDPTRTADLDSLATLLHANGDIAGAIGCLQRAAQFDSMDVERRRTLARWLRGAERCDEAAQWLTRAAEIARNDASIYVELGDTYEQAGKLDATILCYQSAVELAPRDADVHHRLAVALLKQRRADEALGHAREAVALAPHLAVPHFNLGDTLSMLGDADGAIDSYRRGLAIDGDKELAHNRLIFDLATHAATPPSTTLAAAREFGARMAARARVCEHPPPRHDGSKLRIGFVSGDLLLHPVGIFIESVMEHFADGSFELIAYSTRRSEDDITRRLKTRFDAWRSLVNVADTQAVQMIRDDGIDILVDLSGHTVYNRLPMFACKPAPLQVSWLGYFGTTGLATMDYVLGDPLVLPVDEESHYVEKIWRLPDSYLCFTPPSDDVKVGPLPMLQNATMQNGEAGHATFGYFGKLSKVTPAVIGVWSRILHAVPGSKLMLKSHQLDAVHACRSTEQNFAAHGIEASRLVLEGGSPRDAYLAAYNRVDIMLSPFPYPGGTTTAEALWMGTPVVALKGDRFVTHICESVLHAAGQGCWIAHDEAAYLELARAWAARPERLAALRAGLREQTLASPLCDARRFAKNLKAAFEGMWAQHVVARDA
ncbi:Tetratricopeptide repeat-containing protein [Paraburkholderia steynii]|uniref:protein O-GlcNAc transferase n=1 Tax=Paraburkholderia steynii TaxID=1245441 RepID=A0A7Z7FGV5_9BURK|nr:tetratricopeptide repeat protein [Paraburkholderia steynii]SDH72559.1 Tetratricopeptide repeat-containing protein [Paraburkholderia steynii]